MFCETKKVFEKVIKKVFLECVSNQSNLLEHETKKSRTVKFQSYFEFKTIIAVSVSFWRLVLVLCMTVVCFVFGLYHVVKLQNRAWAKNSWKKVKKKTN